MFDTVAVAENPRRWTTLVAFLINSSVIVLAIVVPLLRPDQMITAIRSLGTPVIFSSAPQPVEHAPTTPMHPTVMLTDGRLHAPGRIPPRIDMSRDATVDVGPVQPGFFTIGDRNGVTNMSWMASTNAPPPVDLPKPAAVPRPTVLNISHLDEGMLIRKVQPVYPPMAKATHTQGSVVLTALIDTKGDIVGVQVISGHPLLIKAAVDAVQQWRYRPYILNGQPIEVRTEVTIHFMLQ